jgi:hypothetical protein
MSADTVFINSQIDIRSIVESLGAEFRGNRCNCIIHGGDNQTSFEIFDNGRAWNCHSRIECSRYGHDGIALLRILNNWTFQQVVQEYDKPVDPQEAARRAAQNADRIARELQKKIEEAQKALEDLQKARRWLEYHQQMGDGARELWRERGITDDWQNYWRFGYCLACPTYPPSASLTIPIFVPNEAEPRNIKHRLLTPENPKDKYRPEKSGLPAMPFYGDNVLPIEAADRVILVEGEIKAAVTFATLNYDSWQVIGMPGKDAFKSLPDLSGHDGIWLIPDPDGLEQWGKFAKTVSGRVISLPGKIDDMINAGAINKADLCGMLDQARR